MSLTTAEHGEPAASLANTRTTAPRVRVGDEDYVARLPQSFLGLIADQDVQITNNFREIIDEYGRGIPGTPAGFRLDVVTAGRVSTVDLVRDIGYDSDGQLRPTPLLFSVDSVNPRDIAPWAGLVANMTCNPGIVYDLFLNDPSKNVGREFETIEEVLTEVAGILGPGCDVSVELHNPFETRLELLLEEIKRYEAILGRHRLVVKVPHTGPINQETYPALLAGDGRFPTRFDAGHPQDYLGGHQLALTLQQLGYRVNFTLMFEPHQTPLALQARPYFINAFLRNRLGATRHLRGLVSAWEASGDESFLTQLRTWMISQDFLAPDDADLDPLRVLVNAQSHLRQRQDPSRTDDGLDAARQSLRWLATSNLPDTRLILCSMDGADMFPDLTRMLTEPEFLPLHHRVLITTDPVYLARWTSSPQVISYQRRFMRAAGSRAVD